MLNPGQFLLQLLLGLTSVGVLGIAAYLLYGLRRKPALATRTSVASTADEPAAPAGFEARLRRGRMITLAIALAMLAWVFAGKYLVGAFYSRAAAKPHAVMQGTQTLRLADGTELAYAQTGSANGATLVFTHGWGADRRDWAWLISALPPRYRVVVWDLPGLGESSEPAARDQSLRTMAESLDRVVTTVGDGKPVVLVGHSVGGMINIEYARRFPDKLGRDVAAIVQVNTTYTNPVETKKNADRSRQLQKPVFEPLLHVVSWTSPVARALGWLAYRSGLAHVQLAAQSFAGNQSWEQLDEMARYAYRSSPGVIARGVLGMLHWDGSDVLPRIKVPTLIVSGDEDVTTLPSASDHMQRTIPMSTHLSVSGAAHLGPVEKYRVYADAISTFVDGMPPATVAAR